MKITTLVSRIESIAEKIANGKVESTEFYLPLESFPGQPYKSAEEKANKFKGDVFEVFCELLVRLSPIDDRIGIANYSVNLGKDVGVDGHGIARDGTPATVQCKYRQWDHQLSGQELASFIWSSRHNFRVSPTAVGNMLIITTGKELHWNTVINHFEGVVKCISLDASYGCLWGSKQTIDKFFSLKTIVDKNVFFWDMFRKEVA